MSHAGVTAWLFFMYIFLQEERCGLLNERREWPLNKQMGDYSPYDTGRNQTHRHEVLIPRSHCFFEQLMHHHKRQQMGDVKSSDASTDKLVKRIESN